VTNTWELDRDVLDAKENKVGAVSVSKLDYAVNAIGQRTALNQTGTAFASVRGIAWAYDSYGQVTSADSTLATQDRAYQYDAIGNRKKSADSLTLPATDNYTANALNQYSSLSIPNPQSPISNPIYDLDGNATSYPLPAAPTVNSTLTWDGENRMTSANVNGITTTQQYDATGRRISKTTGTTTRLYLYEGWNVIAEYERGTGVSPVLTLKKTYLWGTDLSGTLQGAGGVGGLLSESNISNPQSPISYPTYDGNGNISEYLTATGAIAAHFEYDPFGNTTINTDTGNQFTYKFSTKPQDVETGLYYYGYRFYDAGTGRWINRDPIGEKGGLNLCSIVQNDTLNLIDLIGLCTPNEIRMMRQAGWYHSLNNLGEEQKLSQLFAGAAAIIVALNIASLPEYAGSAPINSIAQIEKAIELLSKIGGVEGSPSSPSTVTAVIALVKIRQYYKNITDLIDNNPNFAKPVHVIVNWQKCVCGLTGYYLKEYADTYSSKVFYTVGRLTEENLNREIQNAFAEMSKK
jgi:RHS repeat-associated protein